MDWQQRLLENTFRRNYSERTLSDPSLSLGEKFRRIWQDYKDDVRSRYPEVFYTLVDFLSLNTPYMEEVRTEDCGDSVSYAYIFITGPHRCEDREKRIEIQVSFSQEKSTGNIHRVDMWMCSKTASNIKVYATCTEKKPGRYYPTRFYLQSGSNELDCEHAENYAADLLAVNSLLRYIEDFFAHGKHRCVFERNNQKV